VRRFFLIFAATLIAVIKPSDHQNRRTNDAFSRPSMNLTRSQKRFSPIRTLTICVALSGLFACTDPPATPVAAAPAKPLTGCGATATAISEIQGDGAQSGLLGRVVTVQAIVTFAPIAELGGLFVQEERDDRDGELGTSEGLFLTTDAVKTAKAGDVIRATGTVAEIGEGGDTLTSLVELSEFRVCGAANIPSDANIEQAPLVVSDWERFEAMRVHLDLPVTVIRNDGLRRSGELLVSLNGRQFVPTQLMPPGDEARKIAEDNLRSRIWLDDASLAQFPDKISWLPVALSNEAPYRLGTRLGEVHGVLDERAGAYRIHVLEAPVAEQAARPKMPPLLGGALKVASFNLLNWFNGDGKKGGFPTPRGAKTLDDAARQRSKLVSAILAIKPDIAALMEVENDGDEKPNALSELVAELNRNGGLGYQIISPPTPKLGSDAIRVAIIYRVAIVQPKGIAVALIDPPFENFNRVPLAQTFQTRKNAVFTLVVNHFKSKGCGDLASIDPANTDHADGQGCFNAKRVEAARALLAWLKTDPTRSGDPDQLIVGDLNSYAQEDPIRLLNDNGFHSLGVVATPDADTQHYSFAYDGMLGSLDHALASASLKAQVQSTEVWHINADEFPGFSYDSEISAPPVGAEIKLDAAKTEAASRALLYRKSAFRSSDHDPLILGLNLEQ
jgi:uncharacterized protein